MPIAQRGQSFQVTVNHKGERFRRQFPSMLEAQQWELDTKLRLSKGEKPDMGEANPGGVFVIKTFGPLGEYMIEHHWRGTRGEKSSTINMRHMIRLIGEATPLTGMRQGEVLELRAHNLEEDELVLRGAPSKRDRGTKALNTRRVPLTDRALQIIQRRMASAGAGLLFEGYTKDKLRHDWDEMRSALGFDEDEEYVPHALRHTFCSRLVNDHNINLKIVKELAGHLRLETTEKYVHLDKDAKARAIAMLAPRQNSIYTPATTATPSVPHANVACHTGDVAGSIGHQPTGNVLELQRISA